MSERRPRRCRCTVRSPTRTSTCSIARRASSTTCSRRVVERFPQAAVVFEHITTRDGARSSCAARAPASRATITPQHLLLNRNALFAGRPAPASLLPAGAEARARSRGAASRPRRAAIRGSSSAPTARRTRAHAKEAGCGCAGIFSAHAAIELYAEAFEAAGALDAPARASPREFGADFYGLPRNADTHHAGDASRGRCRPTYPFGDQTARAAARRRARSPWRLQCSRRR